ncbi:MAG: hypothetical protein JWM80_2170 [Cyanobacteria bacterium RYN_339]|nr:hypothetical protein [Cyanobacteria bacterium RYN_339]
MPTIADRIDSYFIQMEWPFERIDNTLWRTAFPGDLQIHEVFVSSDDVWISLRSMVGRAPAAGCRAKVNELLLRLNSLIPMTKFSIMENGDIFALIDLPAFDLNYSDFRSAITNLINHVDAHDNEILALCTDEAKTSSLAPA